MNEKILCAVSVTLGIGIGLYIGNKHGYKKGMKKLDSEVESVKSSLKSYYDKKINENKTENSDNKTTIINNKGEIIDIPPTIVNPTEEVDPRKDPHELNVSEKESRARFPRVIKAVPTDDAVIHYDKRKMPPTAVNTPDGYPDPDDKKALPYLIRKEDYGEFDDWDTREFIFWECGTVTTDDTVCEQVSPSLLMRLLPEKWPSFFDWSKDGEYADEIFFRNNQERVDIQIVKDRRKYRDWLEEVFPGRAEEEFG